MALPVGHHVKWVLHLAIAAAIAVHHELALAVRDELIFHSKQDRLHVRL